MTLPKKTIQNVLEMHKDGKTTKEIMGYMNMTKHQVDYILRRVLHIDRKRVSKRPDEDKLYELYILKEMSQRNIANMYGVSPALVRSWLDDAELAKESLKPTKEELIQMYRVEKLTRSVIAHKCEVSPITVSNWINEYGIQTQYDKMDRETCISIMNQVDGGKAKAQIAREYGKTYDWVHRRYLKAEAYKRDGGMSEWR